MVWPDQAVQELSAEFIPCADEVFRLQNGGDAECKLFQRFCDLGHYREPKKTRQGIYAVSASGILLGSINSQSPQRVASMLSTALEKWRQLSVEERGLEEAQRQALASTWRWDKARPTAGLILEVTSRDLLEDESAAREDRRGRRRFSWTKEAWNRDYAWFSADEIASWIPEDLEAGASKDLPARHVERLARFHLMDNVRGQTSAYERAEISLAELRMRIESKAGDEIVLSLSGSTRAEVEKGEYARGFATALEGDAIWNRQLKKFTSFDLFARAESWGYTRFNNRRRGPKSRAVGVLLRQAPADAPQVAPAFIWEYGWPRRR